MDNALPAPTPDQPPASRPPTASHDSGKRAWRFFTGILVVMTAFGFLLVVGFASYFRLSSDVRALRQGVMTAGGAIWQKQIELKVGPMTTGFARSLLPFVHLDAQQRAALSSFRAAEVGLYQLSGRVKNWDWAGLIVAADAAMTGRGWERSALVRDGDTMVMVYAPTKMKSTRNARACVLVVNGDQMVIASASGNLQPLVKLLRQETRFRSASVRDL